MSRAEKPDSAKQTQSLQDVIAAIRKPLSFIAKDQFSNISKVKGLESSLAPHVKALKSFGDRGRKAAEAISRLIDNYDAIGSDKLKSERIKTVLKLLERLGSEPASHKPIGISHQLAQKIKALDTPIQFLKGVGPARAEMFKKLKIESIEDALLNLPRAYEDRRNITRIFDIDDGDRVTVVGEILLKGIVKTRRRIFEIVIGDGSGTLSLKWFHKYGWVDKKFKKGMKVIVNGAVKRYFDNREMHHPEMTIMEDEPGPDMYRVLPIYNATEGLTQNVLRKIMGRAVSDHSANWPEEVVPADLRGKFELMDSVSALEYLHNPPNDAQIIALNSKTTPAHTRMVFEELFALEVGLAIRRRGIKSEHAPALNTKSEMVKTFLSSLPFKLTKAQDEAMQDIMEDISQPQPMSRLMEGDVGCGKTVVALAGALAAVASGKQAAFMAPTEILAVQHYKTITQVTKGMGISVGLLTGSLAPSDKERLKRQIGAGSVDIVVGTHAVIQKDVRFNDLAYAVIDEQHRFGVQQRALIREGATEGKLPHVLVMTATPIPRTLALTLYGDLDLTIIDEMPPGRIPIKTRVFRESKRVNAYEQVRNELKKGRQAYIVFPLVEQSEKLDLKDATRMYEELRRNVFPEFKLKLIHGQMKPAEKEAAMRSFVGGEADALISTTVIEVGIDVPNASVMLVENAERFGLSQLHQLRGRVGRGEHQSWCLLVAQKISTPEAYQRLKVMERTNDGFKIAEKDLEIRGPGEFMGTRQSGLPDFRVANIARDQKTLINAREAALQVVEEDPFLEKPEHAALKLMMQRRWKEKLSLASIG